MVVGRDIEHITVTMLQVTTVIKILKFSHKNAKFSHLISIT